MNYRSPVSLNIYFQDREMLAVTGLLPADIDQVSMNKLLKKNSHLKCDIAGLVKEDMSRNCLNKPLLQRQRERIED